MSTLADRSPEARYSASDVTQAAIGFVFSREGGRGRGSGAEVQTNPTAHLWTIRDGEAILMQSYWERSEALEAAGLRE